MDPVSQGVLGASASLSVSRREHLVLAVLCGWLAGMAPDLDSFIRSDTDPLLYLEYHRQFTHALVFIPVGALICAVVFQFTIARRLEFKLTYIYCLVGYATHGLLDSCTTYGTQLFWPFSNTRVAWHAVSIIDPIFTIPLLLFVSLGAILKSHRWGYIAVIWACLYLLLGLIQGKRAEHFAVQLAASREHNPVRLETKPSFANILVWKTIYEFEGRYYVDAVRVGTQMQLYPGKSVRKLELSRDLPWLDLNSQQAKDLERFRWFSNDYLALSENKNNFIVDMRYSILPNQVTGLWGIQLQTYKTASEHVEFVWDRRITDTDKQMLLKMLTGK
ncbi:MAG: metal-dependent hydrolase [Pseudomonadota bacterium]